MPTFGPGMLQIGAVGSAIDLSCHINSARVVPSKEEGDSTTKLCGTVRPGKITYTYVLSGNIDLDSNDPAGFFALSVAAPGTQQPFTFTPDSATETTASGTLIIDPLEFGGDEFGDDLTSDFEFTIVGPPTYKFPTEAVVVERFQRIVVNGTGTDAGTPAAAAASTSSKTAKAEPAAA